MVRFQQGSTMKSQNPRRSGRTTLPWLALALCAAALAAGGLGASLGGNSIAGAAFAPTVLPIAAAGLAAAGIAMVTGHARWHAVTRALQWVGLMLMVWAANGLPFDLLRLTPLIPLPVDWPGLARRTLALAAAIVFARLVMARPANHASPRGPSWYAYAAFVLALPYPVFRTCWALGSTIGLTSPGAAGRGFLPWLACIPWLLAAVLSLLLASPQRWKPRRLLLAAGTFATAAVALVGPGACRAVITAMVAGGRPGVEGIAIWVPALFYASWLLWAIAAGSATRSYQLRSAQTAG
jgi:hypothetical protein